MGHQVISIVALFFTAVVACNGCYYEKFSPNHTGCKSRNPQCNIVDNGITSGDKDLILKLHNQYRNAVAAGRVAVTDGVNLPSASNMMEMVWDVELAKIAQKHAETCEFEHDCYDCRRVDRFGVGQNLYMSFSSNNPSSSDQVEGMVKAFYDEVKNFRKEYISPFQFKGDYGHFTQVVWANSWRLGCGKVVFKDGNWYKTMISCNYGPAGNIINAAMYKTGSPCSACPANTCCGNSCNRFEIRAKYEALCKKLN